MKNRIKMLIIFAAAAVLSAAFCTNAFASTKKINSVTIHVEGNIQVDEKIGEENLDVTASADHYSYEGYEVQNVGFRWSIEDTPVIKVTLTADDDYYFYITQASQVTVIGGTYVSAERADSSTTLIVEISLTPLANQVTKIGSAAMTDDGVCTWSASDGAGSYEVKFMRNKATLGGTQTVTGLTFDGGSLMTKAGPYHFMVRPVNKNNTAVKGVWVDSNTVSISDDQAKMHVASNQQVQSAGSWETDGTVWKFRLPDGTYPANAWRAINNEWYYFNADGTMFTGWLQSGEKWYYLDPVSGAMVKNTVIDGYQIGIDGTWAPAK